MVKLKQRTESIKAYTKALVKGLLFAVLAGLTGGIIGAVFHICIDMVTEIRHASGFVIYFLPAGAVAISALYGFFKKYGPLDTDRIFDSLREGKKVPIVILPLIFICSSISHLVGASVGREGAAIQLGGTLGYTLARLMKLKTGALRLLVMCGMSAVFSSVFGTPITAAVFAMEVTKVGSMRYGAFLPCVISAVIGFNIRNLFGISQLKFCIPAINMNSAAFVLAVLVIAVLCAIMSRVFVRTIKIVENAGEKFIPNTYLRVVVLGLVLLAATLIFGTDYNGAGMDIIESAIGGNARYEAFCLKLILTAVSIAAGFKGGEIVPAFFVGSTFGCVVAMLIGFDASLGGAIGFVALFCGVVNCPLASVILAAEIFGADSLLMFGLVCAVSYALSGEGGLYRTQKIKYSKLEID